MVGLLSLAGCASFHTTPVETVLADFPHTACGRALGPAVLGSLRIFDGAAQAMESMVPEVLARPPLDLPWIEVPTCTFDMQTQEPFVHVRVELVEAARGISRFEVRAPAPKDGVEVRDDVMKIIVASPSRRLLTHSLPDSFHRATRRLAMQEVHAPSLVLPDLAAQALPEWQPRKSKPCFPS